MKTISSVLISMLTAMIRHWSYAANQGSASPLLANYVLFYRQRNPHDFCLIHFVGCTAESANEVALMRRVMVELKRHFDFPDDVPVLPDQIRGNFRRWLATAGTCGECCWYSMDSTCCMIAIERSTWTGCQRISLQNAESSCGRFPVGRWKPPTARWPEMTVQPLSSAARRQLLHDYLREDARNLDDWAIESILSQWNRGTTCPCHL